MIKKLWLVVRPEHGWDNVVAIYNRSTISLDEVKKAYPSEDYIILDRMMNTRGHLEDHIEERSLSEE